MLKKFCNIKDSFSNFCDSLPTKITKLGRTISVVIRNTESTTKSYALFLGNLYGYAEDAGTTAVGQAGAYATGTITLDAPQNNDTVTIGLSGYLYFGGSWFDDAGTPYPTFADAVNNDPHVVNNNPEQAVTITGPTILHTITANTIGTVGNMVTTNSPTRLNFHVNQAALSGGVNPISGGNAVAFSSPGHSAIKREIAANPFITVQAKFKSNDDDNLANPINYVHSESTGLSKVVTIAPLNSMEPELPYTTGQSVLRIAEFEDLEFNGDTGITGDIAANSTITMLFTIKDKIKITNALVGESIVVKGVNDPPGVIQQRVEIVNSKR